MWTAIIELGAGALAGRRFPYVNDFEAYNGWDADAGEVGAQAENAGAAEDKGAAATGKKGKKSG